MAHKLMLAVVSLALFAATASAAEGLTYSYDKSGLDWPGACNTGERQSPINIVMDEATEVSAPVMFALKYGSSSKAMVVNKGSTIQVVPAEGEEHILELSSGRYKLLQMHVHAFSEHAINGLFSPMEAHFVHIHESDPTKLAVVGVMIRLHRHDENSSWVEQWLPAASTEMGVEATVDVSADFWSEMMDASMGFWAYPGSLTTPECDEIVSWHVLRKAKFLSVGQTAAFMNIMAVSNNGERTDNRLPQPLNGREVMYCTTITAE